MLRWTDLLLGLHVSTGKMKAGGRWWMLHHGNGRKSPAERGRKAHPREGKCLSQLMEVWEGMAHSGNPPPRVSQEYPGVRGPRRGTIPPGHWPELPEMLGPTDGRWTDYVITQIETPSKHFPPPPTSSFSAHPTLPQATADDTQRLCELTVGTGSLRACRPWDQDCHLGKSWSRYEERRQYTKQGGREGVREGDREVGARMREDCRS